MTQPSELYALAWTNPNAPSPKNFAAAGLIMARTLEYARQRDDADARARVIAQMFLSSLDLSMKVATVLSYGGGQFALPIAEEGADLDEFAVTNAEMIAHAEALKAQMISLGFNVELDIDTKDRIILFGWNLNEASIETATKEAVADLMQTMEIARAAASETTNKNL